MLHSHDDLGHIQRFIGGADKEEFGEVSRGLEKGMKLSTPKKGITLGLKKTRPVCKKNKVEA